MKSHSQPGTAITVAFDAPTWLEPDLSILGQGKRSPPPMPISAFGPWGEWICDAAEAAACPIDYVAAPLLAAASALIGNARWAQAAPGWAEPPHLWIGAIGDSGSGKSPGADCLMRDVLPEIERRMLADFPERLLHWRASTEFAKGASSRRQSRFQDAEDCGTASAPATAEPQAPRLRQHDVTVEKVAELLADATPKGLLIIRDELVGWIASMKAYHSGGRAFWIEAYGGRPYRVERKSFHRPLIVPRLAVAVYGGTQPAKLAGLMRDDNDGLLARMLWVWPEPVRFRLGRRAPRVAWAARALDRLRELELQPASSPMPIMVPLPTEGRDLIEAFARKAQDKQEGAGGLLSAALGKARGHALRLALVLEMLWWCGADGTSAPPKSLSAGAFSTAAQLIDDYFIPTAARVYGDTGLTNADRDAITLARWILDTRPTEVHIRQLQRVVRLPGLRTAEQIRQAADLLVNAGWISPPAPTKRFGPRTRLAYSVNPRLWTALT